MERNKKICGNVFLDNFQRKRTTTTKKIHLFAGRAVKRERRRGSSRRQQTGFRAAVNEVARELLRSARSPKRENGGQRYIKHNGTIASPVGSCLCCRQLQLATIGRICYLDTPSGICLFSFHSASATIDRFTLSRHARQNLPLWQLESLVCELARVSPSAGICCLGTLNSICLFIFHFASATVDRICYLGTLNNICLFSFHSVSAAADRTCCIGTTNGICLFSFHFASCISHR